MTINAPEVIIGTKAATVKTVIIPDAATINVDATLSNTFEIMRVLATALLATPTGLVDGQTIIFRIIQGAGGGKDLTFSTDYDFGDEGEPDLTTGIAGQMDLITCHINGTKLACTVRRGFMP